MSSAIFYKFRSEKNTNRILFDGTGLTVFDLKREIIQENRLGDGTDFQLRLYTLDTDEEYEDDSYVIPRASSVVVKRLPAIRPASVHSRARTNGVTSAAASYGNATRYVTGKPRVYQRRAAAGVAPATAGGANATRVNGMTEEERIASMFATQENQWEQTQQEMSTAKPVFYKNQANNNAENEGPPPPGYMCYRCGGRDHWIKNCPTNSDPNFEGKRIRRTTGIPKKFLKSIEIDPESMTPEEMAQRKIMVNEEGKFVVQVADEHSWEDYQRKQQKRLIDQEDMIWQKDYFPELPESLRCPITGGLLRDPVKTSKCCNKTFSKVALEDLLVESDFVCPGCGASDVLLDSLIEDTEKRDEVKKFLETQNLNKDNKKQKTSATATVSPTKPPLPLPVPPFGVPPFPMFPMPFMPPTGTNMVPKVDHQNGKK